MKAKKKNRFLTFIVSCMPGAGEMYMGFMNRGVSMMLLFVLTIIFGVWLEQAAVMAICVVEWFYSFFYANHLASLSDEEFARMEDKSIFGISQLRMPETEGFVYRYNKLIAYLLIFFGGCFLWNTFAKILSWILPARFDFISRTMRIVGNYFPSIAIGCGIIFLGVKMLEGKKMELVPREQIKEDKAVNAEGTPQQAGNGENAEKSKDLGGFNRSNAAGEINGPGKMQDSDKSREDNQEGI